MQRRQTKLDVEMAEMESRRRQRGKDEQIQAALEGNCIRAVEVKRSRQRGLIERIDIELDNGKTLRLFIPFAYKLVDPTSEMPEVTSSYDERLALREKKVADLERELKRNPKNLNAEHDLRVARLKLASCQAEPEAA